MSRNTTRFISGQDITQVTDWNFGAVDQASIRFAAKVKAQAEAEYQRKNDVEAAKAEAIRQSGFTKGFEEGFAQGHAQATLEGQKQIADYIRNEGQQAALQFAQLFKATQQQVSDAEQTIAQGILELACDIARQVIMRDLSINPNAVLPVIRESLAMVLSSGKIIAVRMNPADLEVLADDLKHEFSNLSLNLIPDTSLKRGGCLVEAAGSVIDGSVDRRWQRVVSSLGLETVWEAESDLN